MINNVEVIYSILDKNKDVQIISRENPIEIDFKTTNGININFNGIQIQSCKELFFSYPNIQRIDNGIKEEVFKVAIQSVPFEQTNRVKKIVDKNTIQSGDERDEIYGILLLSLPDDLKLKIEPDYFESQNIIVPITHKKKISF